MSRDPRVRRDAPARGAANMQADRELLQAVEAQPDGARLRLYAWSPPCVSLGHHQSQDALRLDALAADGVEWVRRPTGGAAILHDQEITFALAAPLPQAGRPRNIAQLYLPASQAIVRALRAFGLDARCAGEGRPYGGACFASAGGHEILVGERKICGIALRRGRRAYLLHGSLLSGPAHAELARYLRDAPSRAALLAQSTDLSREGLDAAAQERLARRLLDELQLALRDDQNERPVPTATPMPLGSSGIHSP